MNPPRIELGHAVRLLFADHGVSIKRSRFPDKKPKETSHNPAASKQDPSEISHAETQRRRGKRRSKGKGLGTRD
jgi:poly(A) polymerase